MATGDDEAVALIHDVTARGVRVLLHTVSTNAGAIWSHEELGFVLRRRTVFAALRSPGEVEGAG